LFVALYAIINALFTSTTVFFAKLFIWKCQNQYHSTCFGLFGIFWSDLAFFRSNLAFFCSLGPGNPCQHAMVEWQL